MNHEPLTIGTPRAWSRAAIRPRFAMAAIALLLLLGMALAYIPNWLVARKIDAELESAASVVGVRDGFDSPDSSRLPENIVALFKELGTSATENMAALRLTVHSPLLAGSPRFQQLMEGFEGEFLPLLARFDQIVRDGTPLHERSIVRPSQRELGYLLFGGRLAASRHAARRDWDSATRVLAKPPELFIGLPEFMAMRITPWLCVCKYCKPWRDGTFGSRILPPP